MAAGYSKRSLVDKLGIKAGHRAAIINAPEAYDDTLGALPEDVRMSAALRGTFDFIQFFATGRGELEKRFATLKRRMKKDGMLWVSWPKRASGVSTDVTEDVVREIALAGGLKLVYRVADR